MSFYDKHIFPRLLDLAMRNREATRYRQQIVPRAQGTVLEVGVGSGLNLPFYGSRVERLYALDPSNELLRITGTKINRVRQGFAAAQLHLWRVGPDRSVQ